MHRRFGYTRAVYCGLALLLIGLWTYAPQAVGATTTVNAAWAWGGNGSGALGFEDPYRVGKRPTPAQVLGAGNSDIAAVAAGDYFSLALKTDGTVWAWGENARGELGIGTTDSRIKATQITGLSGVRAISANNLTGLALRNDGTVWVWGDNSHGQLGNGVVGGMRTTPAQVAGLTNITALAAGFLHSLALRSDGTVWAWGDNIAGDLGNDTGVSGQYRPYPLQVAGISGVTKIAAGASGSMALTGDGTVWVWGWKGSGEFGDGTISELNVTLKNPRPVPGLGGVVAIAAGYNHRLAVRSDGTVWAWGANSEGQVGNGTFGTSGCACVTTPVQVTGLGGVTTLSGGSEHSIALKNDGTVWAWGRDAEDQTSGSTGTCGVGQPCRVSPAQVPVLKDVVAIAAGNRHNVVVRRLTLPSYPDVSASTPYQDAIAQLAARGTIRGYANGTFGPNDPTLRAQMAALIARGMVWEGESHTNPFKDQSGVDPNLWRNVGTLAFRGVARGYTDTATCAAVHVAPPCYRPTDNVLYAQAIAFIARAMIAQGAWQQQADDGVSYPNVPVSSGHRADLSTYVHYIGAVPGTSTTTQPWSVWDQPSRRGWFAQALWLAISK